MNTSVLLLTPLIVLMVVLLLGFVGCWLPTQGTGPIQIATPEPYVDEVKNSNPIAYWRLSDPAGSQQANDEMPGNHPGTYQYPTPDAVVLGQSPSLNASDPTATPARFNGGSVWVNPSPAFQTAFFTVEALVLPAWTSSDPQIYRTIVSNFDLSEGERGWVLRAAPREASDDPEVDGHFMAQIGNGTGSAAISVKFSLISLGSAVHLAMTYDGMSLNLFKDGEPVASLPGLGYAPNVQQPLLIGETFQGAIQEVAVYGAPLAPDVIATHFLANQKP